MSPLDPNEATTRMPEPGFPTTLWSVVLDAREGTESKAGEAMGRLCGAYWYPLYAYVRRRGFSSHDSQDLTQELFARLLARDYLRGLQPEKGKFRSFLLASMNHFLADEWDKARARKRGGGVRPISLDEAAAEGRYRLEPVSEMVPEKLFERRWALTLLELVLSRLREDFLQRGQESLFDELQCYLPGGAPAGSYHEVARKLGMTEGAVKVAVHRVRGRYRELLREEIGQTLSASERVDEELRHLLAALG